MKAIFYSSVLTILFIGCGASKMESECSTMDLSFADSLQYQYIQVSDERTDDEKSEQELLYTDKELCEISLGKKDTREVILDYGKRTNYQNTIDILNGDINEVKSIRINSSRTNMERTEHAPIYNIQSNKKKTTTK